MGWSIGYDDDWGRYIGYGVVAYCDHPKCKKVIDRGLAYVCGGEPYGGTHGCGLFFCEGELFYVVRGKRAVQLCERCAEKKAPFKPKPEHPRWLRHLLKDPSWAEWRKKYPKKVDACKKALERQKAKTA
jgi:hypothetical protein